MALPWTINDKVALKNKNYIFISYSHTDKEYVYDALHHMNEHRATLWYDKELSEGDVWNEYVKTVLQDEKCVGAVVFLSKKAAMSDAVHQEIKLINQRVSNGQFQVYVRFIGFGSHSTFISSMTKDSEFIDNKLIDYLHLIQGGRLIYDVEPDKDISFSKMVNFASKVGASERSIVLTNHDKLTTIEGMCMENNTFYYKRGRNEFQNAKDTNTICWRMIAKEKEQLVFVSEYALTYLQHTQLEQYEKYIADQFSSLPYFVRMSVIDEDTLIKYKKEIGNNIPSDFADAQRNQVLRLFYVRTSDGKIELYNFLNARIGGIMEYGRDVNCGVRMILVIDESKIGG